VPNKYDQKINVPNNSAFTVHTEKHLLNTTEFASMGEMIG